MRTFDATQVRHYFDNNTRLFLSLGQGTEGTIHRAVWGPGIRTRKDAVAYVDELVSARIRGMRDALGRVPNVMDLGCGVCATLCRVAQHTEIRGIGITISERQVQMAKRRIDAAGLAKCVSCFQGDFCSLPAALESVDFAYAIESFVLATSADAFFEQCARAIRPGGLLVICDDVLSDVGLLQQRTPRTWIDRFQKGWMVSSLLDPAQLRAAAGGAGFVHEETLDLTPYLELGRPRDWAISLLMQSLGWLPINRSYWSMLYGGHALQVGLKRGYLKYLFSVWRKEGEDPQVLDPHA